MDKNKLNLFEKFLFRLVDRKARKNNSDPQLMKDWYFQKKEKTYYQTLENFAKLSTRRRKELEKFYELFPEPKTPKSVSEMTSAEFYDYFSDHSDLQSSFMEFLLDYISIAYLEGDISEADLGVILRMNNALDIKGYMDQKVSELKYKYTLAQEIMNYTLRSSGSEIDQLVAPDKPATRVQDVEQLKNNLQQAKPSFDQMKKELAKAEMIKAEQERLAKQRKNIVTNAPEALELTKIPDGFASEKQKKQEHQQAVIKESSREEKKKVILRQAPKQLTPSEMIAEKKRLLKKTSRKSGLDIKT